MSEIIGLISSNTYNAIENLKKIIKEEMLHGNQSFQDEKLLDIVIDQGIFESMKKIFDNEMETTEKTLEQVLRKKGLSPEKDDYEYQRQKKKYLRLLNWDSYYRYKEGERYADLGGIMPEDFKTLKKSDETNCQLNRESGIYHISDQAEKELDTLISLSNIYYSILEKRIVDTKKISNYTFEDNYNEYDNYFHKIIDEAKSSKLSDKEYLSAAFDLFNFEDKTSLEWLYRFANYVINNNISQYIYNRGALLYQSPVRLPGKLICMNRAPFLKDLFMEQVFTADEFKLNNIKNKYITCLKSIVYVKNLISSQGSLKNIDKNEWCEFIKENYNLFEWFELKKEWTPKKIRAVRKFLEKNVPDIDKPKIK